jgi:acyl-CoA dehydrogenase
VSGVATGRTGETPGAAVGAHGGRAYPQGTKVERHHRDARILGAGDGTTEIMNEIIAKQLGV